MRFRPVSVSLLLGFALAACAPKMVIRTMAPGRVNLGPTNTLVLADGEGRRSAREFVYADLASQARSTGHFTLVDKSEAGVKLDVSGRQGKVTGDSAALPQQAMYVRVDVLEWQANQASETRTSKDKNGNDVSRTVTVMAGEVLLAASVVDRQGRALLAETEYAGKWSTEDKMDREQVIEGAARAAVANLLRDITPVPVSRAVVLDKADKGQATIIKTAQAGNVAQASDDLKAYLKQNPNNAAGWYNLAVFTDAMGRYDEALKYYDKAIQLGAKKFYAPARAGCAKRKADQDALNATS